MHHLRELNNHNTAKLKAEQSGKAERVDEVNKQVPKPMTKEEYKQMMQGFFPMLKRWRK